MKKIALLSILALMSMSACDKLSEFGIGATKPTIACGSADANSLIDELIHEQVEREIGKEFKDFDFNLLENNSLDISATQATNLLKRIKISLSDVRTTEKTEKSSKLQCEATLRLEIPNDIIQDATDAYKSINNKNTIDFFEDGYRLEGQFYTHNLSYSVQPTDDKTKVFATLNQPYPVIRPISELMLYASFKAPIDKFNQAKAERQAAAEAEQNMLDQEKIEALLKEWTERYKVASNDINTYWENLPKLMQDKLLPTQKAWNESFQKFCTALAKEENVDNAKKEQLDLLICKTNHIEERLDELEEQREKMLPDLINDAKKQSEAAKVRLEKALQNVPQDIMSQIQEDYNHWAEDLESKCQKENDEYKLAQSACVVKAMNKKAKELEDYAIQ